MKRRSFMKKSVAAAIIAASPIALTGLVNAEGGGGPASQDSTGDFTGATYFSTSTEISDFTILGCEVRGECELMIENGDIFPKWWCNGVHFIAGGIEFPCLIRCNALMQPISLPSGDSCI
jgi:hypothetical protein